MPAAAQDQGAMSKQGPTEATAAFTLPSCCCTQPQSQNRSLPISVSTGIAATPWNAKTRRLRGG